ncbi:helix-turn-helix transcriptional regulator [Lysinibacillus sp. NPDC056185]|uniref:helix-turn-helix transcriptional regulator n=1 Tax=Lysinibacillus sp. NPDC056185 TaxID=3345739 RepID=UPI0039EF9BBC
MNTLNTNFHDNFNEFFHALEISKVHECPFVFQPNMQEGAIHRFIPRRDLEVVISDYSFYREHQMQIVTKQPMVELSLCLQGNRGVYISGSEYEISSGTCSLQFIEQVGANFMFHKNQSYQMVGIGIPVSTFNHFMSETSKTSEESQNFSKILGGKRYRLFQERINASSLIIVQQMLDAIAGKNMTNLELECRALQLLSMTFRSQLVDNSLSPVMFSKSDRTKIQQAQSIITERMSNPPTLIELSRLVGLNDYKLKKGFKEMFGKTVFGYLREKRLEKAFLLLQEGTMNVTDIANAVGYSNPSYFAEIFKERFGINPREILRNLSRM